MVKDIVESLLKLMEQLDRSSKKNLGIGDITALSRTISFVEDFAPYITVTQHRRYDPKIRRLKKVLENF